MVPPSWLTSHSSFSLRPHESVSITVQLLIQLLLDVGSHFVEERLLLQIPGLPLWASLLLHLGSAILPYFGSSPMLSNKVFSTLSSFPICSQWKGWS